MPLFAVEAGFVALNPVVLENRRASQPGIRWFRGMIGDTYLLSPLA